MSASNIIISMPADHAAHVMSGYGRAINSTPNLDRIAPVAGWVGYDMRFSLMGRVVRNAGGTTLLIR
jgi:hypothetical protein